MDDFKVSGRELWEWYQQVQQSAIASECSPQEIDWLLQEAAQLDRLTLRLGSFKNWPVVTLKQPWLELQQLWQRRLKERVPLQYLLGFTHWRHFTLQVSPAVLIPRPETELIIDQVMLALQNCEQTQRGGLEQGHWVDLGTGSGAIALGLADVLPQATIHAVDQSPEALAIAQQNAVKLGLQDRIQFHQGSWWQPLESLQSQISGMVSNPPYIPSALISTLQPEVAHHEPHLALDGGEDGLNCIRYLIETAPTYLCSGAIWIVEMMAGQGESVANLLHNQGNYNQISIIRDLAGLDRFVLAYRN